jgi:hypothetical protein
MLGRGGSPNVTHFGPNNIEGALSATRYESINSRGGQPGGEQRVGIRGRGLRPEARHPPLELADSTS